MPRRFELVCDLWTGNGTYEPGKMIIGTPKVGAISLPLNLHPEVRFHNDVEGRSYQRHSPDQRIPGRSTVGMLGIRYLPIFMLACIHGIMQHVFMHA